MVVDTCATYGGSDAMIGDSTGCIGLGDYLGWDFESVGGMSIGNIPGRPVRPETSWDT